MDALSPDDYKKLQLLYDLYEQPLYHIAFSILRNVAQAEDITHDCFIKIATILHQIEDCNSDKTKFFCLRIAKNLAIDRYRKQQKECGLTAEVAEVLPSSENLEESALQKHMLQFLLSSIDEPSREIIKLRCYYNLSYKEIAQQLSIQEDTAMKRFQRAKEKIRQLKGAYYDEP